MNIISASKHKVTGAVFLMIALFLMVAALLFSIVQARFSGTQQKISSNIYQNSVAFYAAEAGLQYGISFLLANPGTVTGSASGGMINYSIGPLTLLNNGSYTVKITNLTANNYNLLKISSTGKGANNSTRTVQQLIASSASYITGSAVARNNVSFVGGSVLSNTINNINLTMGGTLTINNGAYTITSSGTTTTQGNIKSDVQQNVTAYQSMTEPQFFQNVFGSSASSIQSSAQATGTYYNNSVGGGDYSQTLKNKSGVTIFINQSTVSLGQGVTIGTPTKPVTIIVKGNLTIANGVTIYGFVYSSSPGGFNLAGGAKLYGGIASYGNMNITNNFQLYYRQYPKLVGSNTSYALVPGSWKDF